MVQMRKLWKEFLDKKGISASNMSNTSNTGEEESEEE
jgi:hypothetical protein